MVMVWYTLFTNVKISFEEFVDLLINDQNFK